MIPFNLGAAAYFAVWYVPLAACYFAWPILKQRRVYVVAAATLFLAPAIGTRFAAWPAFASVFQMFALSFENKMQFFRMYCLPTSSVYALAAWLIARRYIPPSGSAQTGKDEPERARFLIQQAFAAVSPLRHAARLLLLLVVVMVYSMTSTFAWHSLGNYTWKLINSM